MKIIGRFENEETHHFPWRSPPSPTRIAGGFVVWVVHTYQHRLRKTQVMLRNNGQFPMGRHFFSVLWWGKGSLLVSGSFNRDIMTSQRPLFMYYSRIKMLKEKCRIYRCIITGFSSIKCKYDLQWIKFKFYC